MALGDYDVYSSSRLRRWFTRFLLLTLAGLTACGGGMSSSGGSGGNGGGGVGSGGNGGGTGGGGSPPPNYSGNRTGFVRTDDTPNSAVYDPVHKLVFASEPHLGIVDAISVA